MTSIGHLANHALQPDTPSRLVGLSAVGHRWAGPCTRVRLDQTREVILDSEGGKYDMYHSGDGWSVQNHRILVFASGRGVQVQRISSFSFHRARFFPVGRGCRGDPLEPFPPPTIVIES